jgi:uncharacterized protein
MPGPLRLRLLAGRYAIARLPAGEPIPAETPDPGSVFVSVTRTSDEVSLICEEGRVPGAAQSEPGWRILHLEGTWDLGEVGVLAALARPLADAGVAILAVGTFSTDYLLVKDTAMERAIRCLRQSGIGILAE